MFAKLHAQSIVARKVVQPKLDQLQWLLDSANS